MEEHRSLACFWAGVQLVLITIHNHLCKDGTTHSELCPLSSISNQENVPGVSYWVAHTFNPITKKAEKDREGRMEWDRQRDREKEGREGERDALQVNPVEAIPQLTFSPWASPVCVKLTKN